MGEGPLDRAVVVAVVADDGTEQHRRGAATDGPQPVHRAVAGDGAEPRRERSDALIEQLGTVPQREERFLHDLFCQLSVAKSTEGDPEHGLPMAVIQLPESTVDTADEGGDKLRIGRPGGYVVHQPYADAVDSV